MWLNLIALILLIGGIIAHKRKPNRFVSLLPLIAELEKWGAGYRPTLKKILEIE